MKCRPRFSHVGNGNTEPSRKMFQGFFQVRLTVPTAFTQKNTSRDSLEASPGNVFPDHSQSSSIVQVVVLFLPHALFLLQCHPKSAQAPHASVIPLYHADIQAAAVEGSMQHTLPWLACLRRALTRKSGDAGCGEVLLTHVVLERCSRAGGWGQQRLRHPVLAHQPLRKGTSACLRSGVARASSTVSG